MKKIKSATLDTIEAIDVDVEATFTKGLPSFTIVGMVNSSIQESRDRVKSALLTNEFKFPPKKITINLAPSEIKKQGTQFDLSIALLIALYDKKKITFNDFHIFGELSLNGEIKDNNSIFPIVLSLTKQGLIKKILVCQASAKKLSKIPNINIYIANNLTKAIEFFTFSNQDNFLYKSDFAGYETIKIRDEVFYLNKEYLLDFNEVKGQSIGKKAAMISAAGNHNILFEGSPGCGKTMIAKRLPYIMTPMSLEEILENAKLEALDLKEPSFKPIRVYRSPHHSSTKASIFGGGSINAKIGEVALCNNGILFFDELPHFGKNILEALREPLEDYKILISRVNSKILYKTKFVFVCAMNPCPCGNLLSVQKECRCSQLEISRYKNKLSDPFLDRIDLYIVMSETSLDDKSSISSKQIHEKVINAFIMQKQRGQKELNGKLCDKDIVKYCILDDTSQNLLNQAINQYALSYRGINKVLKVARTIADLNASTNITSSHLLESFSYRRR